MRPNRSKTAEVYASKLVRNLAESGFFQSDVNANRLGNIYNNLARWSDVNVQVYGAPELDEEQYNEILSGASQDSCRPDKTIMESLVECELIHYGVDANGNMAYLIGSDN